MPNHIAFIRLLLFGPKIYGYFLDKNHCYKRNLLESIGDKMIGALNIAKILCKTFSPVLAMILYNKALLIQSNFVLLAKFLAVYIFIGFGVNFLGRLANMEYRKFANIVLHTSNSSDSSLNKSSKLNFYDYQVSATPPNFAARKRVYDTIQVPSGNYNSNDILMRIKDFIAYVAVHTFGRRMLYPGSLSIFKAVFLATMVENRRKLVVDKGGMRGVVLTAGGNKIDTMFIDKRNDKFGSKGNILVIACEGNAGFYEAGIMNVPISLGYSALGWNTPGFIESGGTAMPLEIIDAMDAVMQYAVNGLGFRHQDIVLFAWSIGGFPATWAAMNFPDIKGLILDATFDDLLPLAIDRMPQFLSCFVEIGVRNYLNLPISKQLEQYNGPVVIIRRLLDIMVATNQGGTDEERLASNRANDLLKNLLRSRYPGLIGGFESVVDQWLAADAVERIPLLPDDYKLPNVNDDRGLDDDDERIRLIYYYCSKYFVDFDSTHNTLLNPHFFVIPTSV